MSAYPSTSLTDTQEPRPDMSMTPPAPDAQPAQYPAPQAPTGPVTAYLPQGGFARAVATRLAGPSDVVIPVDHGLVSAYIPYADRACYRCYDRRRRQHGYRPLPPEVVSEHGPLEQAYAHHHVLLGAGLISLALQALDAPSPQDPAPEGADDVAPIGGRVWTIDLVSGITTCSPTVAVDRCETCSGRYEGRRDGLPALAALLPKRRGEVA